MGRMLLLLLLLMAAVVTTASAFDDPMSPDSDSMSEVSIVPEVTEPLGANGTRLSIATETAVTEVTTETAADGARLCHGDLCEHIYRLPDQVASRREGWRLFRRVPTRLRL